MGTLRERVKEAYQNTMNEIDDIVCEDENMNWVCDHEETLTGIGKAPVDREAERERRKRARDAGVYFQTGDKDAVTMEEWIEITQTQEGLLNGKTFEEQFETVNCRFGPDRAGKYISMELTYRQMILMCENQEEEWCDCDFLDAYDANNGDLTKTIVE